MLHALTEFSANSRFRLATCKAPHGSPEDSSGRRHAGDFGNIAADSDGVAIVDIVLDGEMVSLGGGRNNSILGRAMVVHAGEDDLGKVTSNEASAKSGNSGKRLACGIIYVV